MEVLSPICRTGRVKTRAALPLRYVDSLLFSPEPSYFTWHEKRNSLMLQVCISGQDSLRSVDSIISFVVIMISHCWIGAGAVTWFDGDRSKAVREEPHFITLDNSDYFDWSLFYEKSSYRCNESISAVEHPHLCVMHLEARLHDLHCAGEKTSLQWLRNCIRQDSDSVHILMFSYICFW